MASLAAIAPKRGRWSGPVSVEDILWPRNVLGKLPENIIAHIAAAMKEQGMVNSSVDRGAARGILLPALIEETLAAQFTMW